MGQPPAFAFRRVHQVFAVPVCHSVGAQAGEVCQRGSVCVPGRSPVCRGGRRTGNHVFGPEAAQSEGQEEEDDDTQQSFSAGAVTFDRLRGLYQEIEKRYLKGNIQNSETEKDAYEEVYAVQFQMFADGRIKSKKKRISIWG